MKNDKKIRIFAYSCVLLAISIILSYIENIIQYGSLVLGVRIGLSNICLVLGFKIIGRARTFVITMIRVLFLSLILGSIIKFYISFSGFIFSFISMYLYSKIDSYDIIVLSIIGGFAHILGQFFALILILNNFSILYLLPLYLLIGILTGFIIGVLAKTIYNNIHIII